ncbi:MAG: cytochrome c3 family protein [bacterium]
MTSRTVLAVFFAVSTSLSMPCAGTEAVARADAPAVPAGKAAAAGPTNAIRIPLTIPKAFGKLERAPVIFQHDRHTSALKAEGCAACHPAKTSRFDSSFPRERNEKSRGTLVESYHAACIGCHSRRDDAGQPSGPDTCGECHEKTIDGQRSDYLPPVPADDGILPDAHHRNCKACHLKPGKTAGDAHQLDWKSFAVRARKQAGQDMPEVVFDYFAHDKHVRAAKKKCGLCHYLSPELKASLDAAGKQPSSQDWLREEEPGQSWKERESAHARCIGCHLEDLSGKRATGPVECTGCHIDRRAATNAVSDRQPVATPDYGGKERILINTAGATQPAVPFDHKSHSTQSCSECHHGAPEACVKCHTIEGSEAGGHITLADVYHGQDSTSSCVGCHLGNISGKRATGPVECTGCHTGRQGATNAVSDRQPVATPDYGGKERILINATGATQPAVPFDHKSHIAASRSCSECHHSTLEACVKCHTMEGSEAGGHITLAEAYHRQGSTLSCVGCHDREKTQPECAGCHSLRPGGMAAAGCNTCHTGTLESLDRAGRLPDPVTLFPEDLKDEFQISILTNEFEASTIKHMNIARTLTGISNTNRLATYFHRQETTVCAGCHHLAPVEKQKKVPACSACHTARNIQSGSTPALLGAYHQQCLGCHRAMGHPEEKMPQSCTGCHRDAKGAAGNNERK